MRICIFFLMYGWTIFASGQNPEAQFSLQAVGCLGENIILENQSTQAGRYEWDLCQGDISLSPAGLSAGLVPESNIPTGIDVVYDGTEWYAFVTNRNSHSIVRMALGAEIGIAGATVNLGNIDSKMSLPTDIKIVADNGKWYGFVFNEGANIITRLDFGISLTNTPTATTLLNETTSTSNQGLDVIRIGTDWYVVYTFNSKIGILRLATIESIPTITDQLLTNNLTGNPSLGDIKILVDNGQYYSYTCAWSSVKLYKLSFGSNIFSQPVESDISTILPSGLSYYGIDGGYDAGFKLILSTLQGVIVRIDLNADLSQAPQVGQNLGNLGVVFNTVKNRLIKHKSSWFNFSVDYVNGTLFKASFPPPATCQLFPGLFTDLNLQLEFEAPGVKYISLRSFNGGEYDEVHKSITISSLNAPSIDFTNQQVCLQSPIQFISISDQTITSQTWDFGDAQTSSLVSPQNTYAAIGTYNAKLNVISTNGCTNTVLKNIKIYNQPTPTFTLPTGLICTNNEFTFPNTTTDNFDGNLSYEWLVNDVSKSTVRYLKHAFTSVGDQQIKLKTSIPGCTTETIQTLLDVKTGPTVAFTVAGKCEDESIIFSNGSTGAISGYLWNFGDGNSDAQQNTAHAFPDPGNYSVSLQTNGTNGCTSALTKTVNIYSVPQPNFSIELPPFSCAGTPSQFNDLTPPMPDSNVATWAWSFGDAANGSSSNKNPLYTYSLAGDYTVSLLATTNFGCSNSIQKTVAIKPSPVANFSLGPACVNQGTQFSDLSTGDIKSWLWSVQNKTYAVKNAQHIFNSPATYNIMLTVAANNNCIGQITKTVIVPVPVAPDFTVQAMCATKPALFNAVNPVSSDPAVSWSWDFAGQAAGTGASAQHIFPLVGNYSVAMSTTRQSGCTYSVIKIIPVIAPPKALFSLFLNDGAAPFAVEFVNTSSQATTYLWKFGDASNVTSNSFSPSFTYTTLGNYMAELVAGNAIGCTDTFSQPINVVVPTINAAMADFELKKTSTGWSPVATIENKSNIALINPDVYLDISGGALISEKINGVIKPGAKFTHIFTTNISPRAMDYACAEIKINADTFLFDNRQCVNVTEQFISVAPYPNPANEELIFEWIAQGNEPLRLVIYNSSGQVALNREYSSSKVGLNQVKVDVTNLKAGIYFTTYSVDGLTQNFRFSVAR